MSDGDEIEIRHPELLMIERESFSVYNPSNDDEIYAGHNTYNLDHVLSVAPANQEQQSAKR